MSHTMMTNEITGYFKKDKPFNREEPIRLFIGTSENFDPTIEKVYLYSILKNTNHNVEVTWLRPSMFPTWRRKGWGTPFTCFRYAIPEMCGFKGKALYTDCDMINFRDIFHLWRIDLKGKPFGMVWDSLQMNNARHKDTPQERGWWCDSIMLIDCEKAKEHVHSIEEQAQWDGTYKWSFMESIGSPFRKKSEHIVHEIDARWNSFDGCDTAYPYKTTNISDITKEHFELEEIWQVHLTALSYQPWHPKYSPHAKATHKRQDIMEVYWKYQREVKQLEKLSEV
jgi:lipopolysaccharide biosynthesis glycosyltransferase